MRLMTYNIWNYNRRWRLRREKIAHLIRAYHPDVVALQETRHDFRYERGRGQGDQLAELTGYHTTWEVGQVYFPFPRVDEGLTILTRDSPADVFRRELTQYPHERGDDNRRVVLGVRIAHHAGEVDVYNAHFSLSARVRVRNAMESHQFIANYSGDRQAFLLGDLNALPDTLPIRYLLGQEEVEGLSADFVDCWDLAHPGDEGFTYASWAPDHRVDYALARGLKARIAGAERIGMEGSDGVFPSDHIGIVVDLE